MIRLTFSVEDISTVMSIYDQIRVMRADSETPVNTSNYTMVSGTGFPIDLVTGQSTYIVTDPDGTASNWYISQYYSTSDGSETGWTDPRLGETSDLFYNPLYPEEVVYGTSDKLIIDRIRLYIGDPIDIRREVGDEAASNIHPDNQVYELGEKGWPVSVTVRQQGMNTSQNPTVNGYKYLIFQGDIADETTVSGVVYGVDVWYRTFRFSDREIFNAYENCFPPAPLTTSNATSEVYMVQTAIDLLTQETWLAINEDGAVIKDEGSTYDPSPGLRMRRDMLAALRKRLDDLIQALKMSGIEGVRIE